MKEFEATRKNRHFVIKEDLPEIGWYLYVYEGGKCLHDYLQNTLGAVLEQAKEDLNVPMKAWVERDGAGKNNE